MSFLFVPFLLKLLLWGRDFPASFTYPKHPSSPLTKVRNDFKSFVSLHLLLLFKQWRVYVFFILPLQLLMYGVEIFPLLSHHSTLTSVFHSLVRHYCFMPLIMSVLLWVKNDWKYGATYHSYHQRLSGETTRDALRSSNVFSSRFPGILRSCE